MRSFSFLLPPAMASMIAAGTTARMTLRMTVPFMCLRFYFRPRSWLFQLQIHIHDGLISDHDELVRLEPAVDGSDFDETVGGQTGFDDDVFELAGFFVLAELENRQMFDVAINKVAAIHKVVGDL